MTLFDQINRKIPEYYPYMYLDGFTPQEIMYARKKQMLDAQLTADEDDAVAFVVEVK